MRSLVVTAIWLAGCDHVFGLQRHERDARTLPDAHACATGYERIVGVSSMYKFVAIAADATDQHLACIADGPGMHLMVPSTMDELTIIHGALVGRAIPEDVWIGVVQEPNQQEPNEGWISLTGEAPVLAWSTAFEREPNDGSDNEETSEEQVAQLQRGPRKYLIDQNASSLLGAICECDGRDVTTAAAAAMAATR